jgi:hypothetical protein
MTVANTMLTRERDVSFLLISTAIFFSCISDRHKITDVITHFKAAIQVTQLVGRRYV